MYHHEINMLMFIDLLIWSYFIILVAFFRESYIKSSIRYVTLYLAFVKYYSISIHIKTFLLAFCWLFSKCTHWEYENIRWNLFSWQHLNVTLVDVKICSQILKFHWSMKINVPHYVRLREVFIIQIFSSFSYLHLHEMLLSRLFWFNT